MTKIKNNKNNTIAIIGGVVSVIVAANILFIFLLSSSLKSYQNLKKESTTIESQQSAISSAIEAAQKYENYKVELLKVFPGQENLPQIIEDFEKIIIKYSDNFKLNFGTYVPIVEQDKLYLPMSIAIRTDLTRLVDFFNYLETIPYMTHINNLSVKLSQGTANDLDVNLGIKIYVRNPFASIQ